MTKLVASLPVRQMVTPADLKKVNADLVELRLDYMENIENLDFGAVSSFREKLILTIRDISEGGVNRHVLETKARLLKSAVDSGYLIDVEAAFAEKYDFDCRRQIVSRHFLDRNPDYDELCDFVEMYKGVSKITKIALRQNNDSRRTLIKLLNNYDNLAVMEVDGETSSRILYSILGSRLLYCHAGEKTSQGQISCTEASDIFSLLKSRKL